MDREIKVAQTGTCDFKTIQSAIDSIKEDNESPVTILIKAGTYKEVVTIPEGKRYIKLVGEGKEITKITFDNYAGKLDAEGKKLGTNNSATVFINANHFTAVGITFENSYYREGLDSPGRQAVAVNTVGKDVAFLDCAFKGYQDTLYAREGSCFFMKCYIEGDIDFIFGGARAVFDRCEIHSLYGGSQVDNGYVTAASTKASEAYGFLFVDCQLTADDEMPDGTVYLGRPWHPSARTAPVCSSTVFKNCQLGAHIHHEGWTVMGEAKPENERYYEYNNTGAGALINSHRRQLTQEEAEKYTKANVLRLC